MKLIKITIKGLFSYKEESSMNLDEKGLTLINGEIDKDSDVSNGAGKSSILDSICLCLFKCTTRGTENDDVVNDDLTSGSASLIFLSGTQMFLAQYERNKLARKTNWKIFHYEGVKWIDISGRTLAETEDVIHSIIKMNYAVFTNSLVFAQNGVSVFIDGTDSKRKELFTQILDLDVLNSALKETKTSISSLQELLTIAKTQKTSKEELIASEQKAIIERDKAQSDLIELDKTISTYLGEMAIIVSAEKLISEKNALKESLKDWENAFSTFNNSHSQIEISSDNSLRDISSQTIKLNEQISRIYLQREKLPSLKTKLDVSSNQEQKILELREESLILVQKESDLTTQIKRNIIDEDKLSSQADRIHNCIGDNLCPYCAQGLDSESRNSVLNKINCDKNVILGARISILEKHKLTLERINQIKFDITAITKNMESKEIILKEINSSENFIELIPGIKSQIDELKESSVRIVSERDSSLSNINNSLLELTKKLEEVKAKINQVKSNLLEMKLPDKSKEELDVKISLSKIDRDSQMKIVGSKDVILKQIKEAKLSIIDLAAKIKDIEIEIKHERFIEEMFGPDGIKSLIIESITPHLTELANKYLEVLSPTTPITVEFVTSYEGKSKDKVIDDFKILVNRGTKVSDVRSFSGGERKKIEFAIRLAISDILMEKSGCNARFLFMDEPFDSLDKRAIESTVKVLRSLEDKFCSIFAMCHVAEAKESFDYIVTVKKTGDASLIVQSNMDYTNIVQSNMDYTNYSSLQFSGML